VKRHASLLIIACLAILLLSLPIQLFNDMGCGIHSTAPLFLRRYFPIVARAQSADPVVRALLFFSPTCPHCAMVIQEDLPPLFDKYGAQLEIIGVDVTQAEGITLYQAAITRYQIPPERAGVPTLVVGDTVLVGSLEIPGQFPALIEYYLSQGGVDWPDLPGLSDTLVAAGEDPPANSSEPQPATEEPASSPQEADISDISEESSSDQGNPAPTTMPSLTLADERDLSWQEKFALDPAGNMLSVIVLVGMLGALLWGGSHFARRSSTPHTVNASWLVPALCLVGIVVAAYLTYVETAQVAAVCGPVGDCNTVQQSEYARLFGLLPIGVLGLVGYALIVLGALALLGMTVAGTLFSVYLTFLEPFVIGATCAWCLTSAVVMTLLMLLALWPGKQAYLGFVKGRAR
jgi:uncharacterized membrane protein/thiol-disulfide isomerase/thioredoxin